MRELAHNLAVLVEAILLLVESQDSAVSYERIASLRREVMWP